jgi:hypothetical protein
MRCKTYSPVLVWQNPEQQQSASSRPQQQALEWLVAV